MEGDREREVCRRGGERRGNIEGIEGETDREKELNRKG